MGRLGLILGGLQVREMLDLLGPVLAPVVVTVVVVVFVVVVVTVVVAFVLGLGLGLVLVLVIIVVMRIPASDIAPFAVEHAQAFAQTDPHERGVASLQRERVHPRVVAKMLRLGGACRAGEAPRSTQDRPDGDGADSKGRALCGVDGGATDDDLARAVLAEGEDEVSSTGERNTV